MKKGDSFMYKLIETMLMFVGVRSQKAVDGVVQAVKWITLILVTIAIVISSFYLAYLGKKDYWISYNVTVQDETYECNAYRLSDEDIVLYREYYSQNVLDDDLIPYQTIEISDKSEVEIKEIKSEDYKTFGGWLKDYFSFNSDVEWGR